MTDFLEEALPAAERARFLDHVADCRGCSAHLAQMHQMLHAVGTLREDPLPADVRDTLLRAFHHRQLQ